MCTSHNEEFAANYMYQGCDLTKVKNPEPPGCLILEDLQTLHIPTNKKLEVWTQCRLLLSFLGGYLSSLKKIFRQREICKKIMKSGKSGKSGEITGQAYTSEKSETGECKRKISY